jgi:hypothetical protein
MPRIDASFPTEIHLMKRFGNGLRMGALALCIVVAAGCASAGLVNVWSQPDFSSPMKNMLVIAMSSKEGNRRIIEDAFVAELAKYGVQSRPSYEAFPSALPDTQAVRDYVLSNKLNGVVVAARLPTQHVTLEAPGYTTTETRSVYNNWSGRYHTYYVEVQHQGTTQTQRIVPHRVDVWFSDGKGGQMVWTGQTSSIDPSSVNQVSREMSGTIVPAMAKAGVIPQKP